MRRTTVALDCLGCKLNQAEVQQIAAQLAGAGYSVVPAGAKADVYVLNTCTVTHVADRKSRQLLRQARRRNPAARLIAVGCYAEREPETLAGIEGVELVLGNKEKWQLPELLGANMPPKPCSLIPGPSGERTRAFIKVQDGCRNGCAYCIVPLVRPRKISVPAARVLAQVREKAAAGFKEVVLTGTEIGDYCAEGLDFRALLQRLLEETGIARIRLSSLQPHHITPPLIGLWQDPRLCPHFHLSLQSGSDAVLPRMKRRYTLAEYQNAVALIRAALPEAAITTDVIVGFPGETDAEFIASREFCRQVGFARIHVFPYSLRPGTAAALMAGQVPENVKKERSKQMLALARESARHFRACFLDQTREVLWEQKSGGAWSGLTGNYIKVFTRSGEDLANRLSQVKLIKLYRDGVWGEKE